MTKTLEAAFQRSIGSEDAFDHKRILYIGSESYDAPCVTFLQGLQSLGFEVLVIKRSNINSWFCETIIDEYEGQDIDFILSNLHWGTRWDYYETMDFPNVPKILIDGDDDVVSGDWRKKYAFYHQRYKVLSPDNIPQTDNVYTERWITPMGDYQPDIVFCAQKGFDNPAYYIPFGIQNEYLSYTKENEKAPFMERSYFAAHVPGPGIHRRRTERLSKLLNKTPFLPFIHTNSVRGEAHVHNKIKAATELDKNKHSYHRWQQFSDYYKLLQNTKILIYPGVDHWPFWDSKRPWEALSQGTILLMKQPTIDVSAYPLTELAEECVYDGYWDLTKHLHAFSKSSDLEALRDQMAENALKYFTPEPIARYALSIIKGEMK